MIKSDYISDNLKNKGFTMIELTIFLTVASLLMGTALLEYSKFKRQKIIGDTQSHRISVSGALSAFIGNFGRLPCPADPSLPPADPMAGMEVCLCPKPPPADAFGPPICTKNMNIVPSNIGNVNRVVGFRSTTSDPETLNGSVLLGSVPYVTLGITHNETMDGWGSTFTYAVTESMTIANRFNADNGTIQKLFRSNISPAAVPPALAGGDIFPELAKINPVDTANAFMIALISHGRNKAGGYNYQGKLIAPCLVASLDGENCDGDATFLNADPLTDIYNLVPGPLYFDDAFASFTVTRDGDKWAYTSSTSMKNKTGGKVGIGTSTPVVPLHIANGDILVETGSYKSSQYCNDVGGDCFSPSIIGGIGINCGFNGFMTGISSGNVTCVQKIDPTLLITGSCPANQYIRGINAGGSIICESP